MTTNDERLAISSCRDHQYHHLDTDSTAPDRLPELAMDRLEGCQDHVEADYGVVVAAVSVAVETQRFQQAPPSDPGEHIPASTVTPGTHRA